MTATELSSKLLVLKLLAEYDMSHENIASKVDISQGRLSQILKELKKDDLIVEEESYYLTREGYELVIQELLLEPPKISRLEEKTLIEEVVVSFQRKEVASIAEKGWHEKTAKIKREEFEEVGDDYIRINDYNTVILKQDGIQIHLGKIYSNNLLQAKKKAIEEAEKILDELEEKTEETLRVYTPEFDGLLSYQAIQKIEKPPHFYQGKEPVTKKEIEERGSEGDNYMVWSPSEEDRIRIEIPMSTVQRRNYRKLKINMYSQPERFLRLPSRLDELEEKLDRLDRR